MNATQQLDIIRRGTAGIISEEELAGKLKASISGSKPLRVKAGFDPTAEGSFIFAAVGEELGLAGSVAVSFFLARSAGSGLSRRFASRTVNLSARSYFMPMIIHLNGKKIMNKFIKLIGYD